MKKVLLLLTVFVSLQVVGQTEKTVINQDDTINLEFLGEVVIDRINKYRKRKRINPLFIDDSLSAGAMAHTRMLVKERGFYHSDGDFGEVLMRFSGYDKGITYLELAKIVIDSYRGSEAHWAILMDEGAVVCGVGIIVWDSFHWEYDKNVKKRVRRINGKCTISTY